MACVWPVCLLSWLLCVPVPGGGTHTDRALQLYQSLDFAPLVVRRVSYMYVSEYAVGYSTSRVPIWIWICAYLWTVVYT